MKIFVILGAVLGGLSVAAGAFGAHALRTLLLPLAHITAGKGAVPGVPLDAECLIFVFDTSGSMLDFAWKSMIALHTHGADFAVDSIVRNTSADAGIARQSGQNQILPGS